MMRLFFASSILVNVRVFRLVSSLIWDWVDFDNLSFCRIVLQLLVNTSRLIIIIIYFVFILTLLFNQNNWFSISTPVIQRNEGSLSA